MAFELNINGKPVQVDAPDDMPLLWVLRDIAGMTGTKYGCGMAQCGACTVHVAGQPVRSCVTPASALAGQPITTIEGVAAAGPVAQAVQETWIARSVAQCGYCQSGQIMSAIALLEGNRNPSDAVGRAVQDAWVEQDVVQCGYCQSGQIMSACALLKSTSRPTDQNIEESMGGNLCRCGTYPRIRAAIKSAAAQISKGGA